MWKGKRKSSSKGKGRFLAQECPALWSELGSKGPFLFLQGLNLAIFESGGR